MPIDTEDPGLDLPAIMDKVNHDLNAGHCGAVRFALVIWCDCQEDGPLIASSSSNDVVKMKRMLQQAANAVDQSEPVEIFSGPMGHA